MATEKVIKIKVDTTQAQKGAKDLSKEVKKVGDKADDTKNSLNQMTGGAVSRLNGLKTSLLSLVKGFKSLRVAILATGIGALLIAIVAVGQAFKRSEEGQNKFAKIMGVIGTVIGNLLDLLADLGEAIVDAILSPKKAWDSFVDALETGYKFIKRQVVDRFVAGWDLLSSTIEAGILKMRIAWNEFTGDAEEAEKLKKQLDEVIVKAKESAKVIQDLNQEIADSYNDAKDALSGFIDEQLREAQIAQDIADARAKADKLDRKLIVDRAKADLQIAKLRNEIADKEKFTADERIEKIKEAGRISEAITNQEIQSAIIKRDALIKENKQNDSNKEALNAEAQAVAEVIKLQTARFTLQKAFTAELVNARREQKALDDAEKKEQDKERAEKEAEAEKERQGKQLALIKKFANAKEAILKGVAEKLKEQEEEELLRAEVKERTKQNLAEGTFNLLNSLAEEGNVIAKGLAVVGVVRDQTEAISNTISATTVANAKAVATSPTTGGQPWVGINTASAVAGIAGSAITAGKAIKDILSEKKSVDGGGGGAGAGGGRSSAPSFNIVEGSDTNVITESIASQQGTLRAYVVSQEVTDGQELDRSISSDAVLG